MEDRESLLRAYGLRELATRQDPGVPQPGAMAVGPSGRRWVGHGTLRSAAARADGRNSEKSSSTGAVVGVTALDILQPGHCRLNAI